MMRTTFRFIIAATAVLPSLGFAQQRPPIRQLGAVVAKSSDAFTSISGIRALSDGRVLVNDVSGRRLVLYDALLGTATLVADSTSATATAYAGRTGGLIPFRGDSSIFVDPSSMSMLIVDGAGKIARVMSVPRTQDVQMLAGQFSTSVGFDPRGRLVYRAPPNFRGGGFGPGGPGGGGGFRAPEFPDSLPIVRVDLATRQVDTIAYGKIPKVKLDIVQNEGRISVTTQINPLPTVDDFVMLPDGTVALVRGSDYHVDFYNTDGTKVSAPKIAFDWQRLTDDEKVAFIDSVKANRARQLAATPAPTGGAAVGGGAGAGGGGGGGGGPQIQVFGDGGGGRRPGAGAGGGGGGGPQINFVSPSELPDYKPAFFAGSTKVDAAGNLWIRTIPTKKVDGGPVYDVVNRKGELIDRVQVPLNSSVTGFGSDGSVFLALQNNSTFYLEKAKLR
ncbi:MAG: hypothetical protein M3Z17_11850 [Gemmatimonadota bacterium]|nr:hypothetical protein [Gemmatimonadota bacterium]